MDNGGERQCTGFEAVLTATIYKIAPAALWREAEQAGTFTGASVDLADGYIHFSTAAQVRETAARPAGPCVSGA